MNDKIYNDIYEELNKYLPKNWKKLVYRAEYSGTSFEMRLYIMLDNNKYSEVNKLFPNEKVNLIKSYIKLDKIISPERKSMSEAWSVMILSIDNNGKMKANYDYTDISEISIDYRLKWEKDFFKNSLA